MSIEGGKENVVPKKLYANHFVVITDLLSE